MNFPDLFCFKQNVRKCNDERLPYLQLSKRAVKSLFSISLFNYFAMRNDLPGKNLSSCFFQTTIPKNYQAAPIDVVANESNKA